MNDERRKKVVVFLIRWNFCFAKFAEATVGTFSSIQANHCKCSTLSAWD